MAFRLIPEDLSPDEAAVLHVAAVVGIASLACELERMGYSSEERALQDARGLRPLVLAAAQADPGEIETARAELRRRRSEAEPGI